ncbi:hypothetical protein Dip518_000055 [Parelusimicrobium proximum]|uniref:hypothetical protein n=1 Tax=Parelusimicrobium proximum TaxID=3228953 RepID=UPI003D169AAD
MKRILLILCISIICGCAGNKMKENKSVLFETHLVTINTTTGMDGYLDMKGFSYLGKITMFTDGSTKCECLNRIFKKYIEEDGWKDDQRVKKDLAIENISFCNTNGYSGDIPEGVTVLNDLFYLVIGRFDMKNSLYKKAFLSLINQKFITDKKESFFTGMIYEISSDIGDKYLRNKWNKEQYPYELKNALILEGCDVAFFEEFK